MSIDERARELCWKYGLTHAVVGDSMFKTEPTPVLSSAIAEAIREPLRELRGRAELARERWTAETKSSSGEMLADARSRVRQLEDVLSWLSALLDEPAKGGTDDE